jgi:hypothetical protein
VKTPGNIEKMGAAGQQLHAVRGAWPRRFLHLKGKG